MHISHGNRNNMSCSPRMATNPKGKRIGNSLAWPNPRIVKLDSIKELPANISGLR